MCGTHNPTLPPTLFNGDLSSLYKLHLECVWTHLPWRNIVNLTSFTLAYKSPLVYVRHLDFLKSAPHLRKIDILSATQISSTQGGWLVSLACLQRMDTSGHSSSHLFDHLLIPVGVHLKMGVDLPNPLTEGCPLRFIDNLGNLSDFTAIKLDYIFTTMTFSGPNGKVRMVAQLNRTELALESLDHFDSLKTQWLKIKYGNYSSSDLRCRVCGSWFAFASCSQHHWFACEVKVIVVHKQGWLNCLNWTINSTGCSGFSYFPALDLLSLLRTVACFLQLF